MKNLTKKTSLLVSALVSLSCLTTGALCWNSASAKADEAPISTSITMLAGANLRKNSTLGLKFTGEISDYNENYQYGMLVIPADWLSTYTFNDNYIDVLNAEVGESGYHNVLCMPYQDVEENGTKENPGEWRVSTTFEGFSENYSVEYIGIAYVKDDAAYKYASYDVEDNARSVMYVAQMALKHDTRLTEWEAASLEQVIHHNDTDVIISETDCLVYDAATGNYDLSNATIAGSASVETGENKVLSIDFNSIGFDAGKLSIHTKEYYFDVTQISFKAKFDASWNADTAERNPGGAGYGWWGINYFTDYENADLYSNMTTVGNRSTVNNDWETITFNYDVPFSGYISIIGAVGEFANPVILIDDFTIVSEGDVYTENFDNTDLGGSDGGMFVKKADDANISIDYKVTPSIMIGSAPSYNAMTIANSLEILNPMRSKEAYTDISSIKFDIILDSSLNAGWGGFQMGYATGDTTCYEYDKVYQHLGAGGKLTFHGGYFEFLTSLTKGTLYHADIKVVDTNVSATFTADNGDVKAASCTLTTTENLYISFYHHTQVPASGTYTISDFEITSAAGTQYGVTNVFNGGGEDVTFVEELDENYNFNNILAGSVSEYLASGNYASITGGEVENYEDLPASAAVLATKINYTLVDEKEFAIVVGGTVSAPEYLYVNNNSISYYKNTTKVGESIALTNATNELLVSVTATGKLNLSVNGKLSCIGTVSDFAALKLVGMGGAGSVCFNSIKSSAYSAVSTLGSAQTIEYAQYQMDGTLKGLEVVGETASYVPTDVVLTTNLSVSVSNADKIAWATSKAYEYKSLSFDIFMPALASKTGWLGGFAFKSSVMGVYDTEIYGSYGLLTRNAWNHVEVIVNGTSATMTVNGSSETLSVPAGESYFYMTFNPGDGKFDSTDILKFNNFTIVDANGTYTDTFDDGMSTLLTAKYSLSAGFGFEEPDTQLKLSANQQPAMLGILGSAIGANEVIAAQLKDMYSNVTEITFKAKYDNTVVSGKNADRWGLGISTTQNSYPSYYSLASFDFPQDNQWHEYRFVFNADSMDMYLDEGEGAFRGTLTSYKGISLNNASTYQFYIIIAPKSDINVEETLVYLDDFSITANGTTYTDDFSTGVDKLFDKATGVKPLQSIYVGGNGNSMDNIASVITSLDSYICGAEFNLDGLKDNKKVLNGSISYSIERGKEFAIVLGESANGADFLYVTANKVSFCKVENGALTVVKEMAASATNTLQITLLKCGDLTVNGEAMGTVSNVKQLKIADVNGVGNVTFTAINLTTQKFVKA